MAERQFAEVVYKEEENYRRIKISEMTEQNYIIRFKGHIFCPTDGCTARMKFVQLTSGNKYFASIDKDTHTDECSHKKDENQEDQSSIATKDVSEHHIKASLRYYMKKYLLKSADPPLNDSTEKAAKKKTNGPAEETLLYSPCEEIDSSMAGMEICTGGVVEDIQIVDDEISNRHAFINFDMKGTEIGVSVKISPSLYRNDSDTADYVIKKKKKSDNLNKSNEKLLFCTCYGRISTCDKGYNIIPLRLLSIHFATKAK